MTRLALRIGNIVLVPSYMYRANQNVRQLETQGLVYSPSGALGLWFLPIANLVLPYYIVKELYLTSDPKARGHDWQSLKPPKAILSWWLLFLASFALMAMVGLVMDYLLEVLSFESALLLRLGVALVGYCSTIIAGILLIRIVRSIAQRQTQRADELAAEAAASQVTFAD